MSRRVPKSVIMILPLLFILVMAMRFLVGYFVLEIMHESRMPDDEEVYE